MKYSSEHIAFLRRGYKKKAIKDLAMAFNKKFSLDQSTVAIKSALTKRGLTSGRIGGFPKGSSRLFDKNQVKFIKSQYTQLSRKDLCGALNKQFSLTVTVAQVTSFVKNHKITSGRSGHYQKGHKPWLSGTKGLTGRNKTSFSKGQVPPNRKPLGSERIDSQGGSVLIKVAETNPWNGQPTHYRHKNKVVWEQQHGPVPAGYAIIFLDSDKSNCEPENLRMVTRSELLYLNKNGYKELPAELRETMLAIAKLQAKVGEIKSNKT